MKTNAVGVIHVGSACHENQCCGCDSSRQRMPWNRCHGWQRMAWCLTWLQTSLFMYTRSTRETLGTCRTSTLCCSDRRHVVGPSLTGEQYYEEGYQMTLSCSQVCPALIQPTRGTCSWSSILCENKICYCILIFLVIITTHRLLTCAIWRIMDFILLSVMCNTDTFVCNMWMKRHVVCISA